MSYMSFLFLELKLRWLPSFLNDDYYTFLFEDDFKAIIPECFLLFAICTLLLYGVAFSNVKQNETRGNDKNLQSPTSSLLGVSSSWVAILSIFFTLPLLWINPISEAALFYHHFVLDNLALFFKILVIVGSLFSILISLHYIEQESLNNFELQAIILVSTVSMLFLISSADFIWLYLAIELQSLCLYVMAGVKRENEFSSEAGLKYFLLGAFSSGILAFGLALQYGFTGTTHFSEASKIFLAFFSSGSSEVVSAGVTGEMGENSVLLFSEISSLRGCELGMIFILVGLLFKLTAVPFHMWAPDVYEGAPTSVTAFFAIVPKVSIYAILIRLCYVVFYDFMIIQSGGEGFYYPWQKMLILSSIASMILGSLAALSQNKIKRLLAWSSIGHVGYVLVAICCGTIQGIQAVAFYLVIYVVMTISLFQVVLCSMRREIVDQSSADDRSYSDVLPGDKKGEDTVFGEASQNQRVKYTTDLAQLAKSNSVLALTITITMFSIAGIPPLAGFYSKAFLLFAAMSVSQYLLATVVILTSVVSCFYYIRVVKIMYFEGMAKKASTKMLTFVDIPKESSYVFGLTIAGLAFFCFFPTPLYTATHKMALSLCF